jgi:hypothetical protein
MRARIYTQSINKLALIYTFIFLNTVYAVLVHADENGDNIKRLSIEVLDDFVSKNYASVYDCRDQDFKEMISYKQYIDHIKEFEGRGIVLEAKFKEINKKKDLYFVNFDYQASLKGMTFVIPDFQVWHVDKKNIRCLDAGFRLLFPLNQPIKAAQK